MVTWRRRSRHECRGRQAAGLRCGWGTEFEWGNPVGEEAKAGCREKGSDGLVN